MKARCRNDLEDAARPPGEGYRRLLASLKHATGVHAAVAAGAAGVSRRRCGEWSFGCGGRACRV